MGEIQGNDMKDPSKEAAPNLKQKIIDAIHANDIKQLIQAVEEMNTYLTSHSKLGVPNQITSQEGDFEDFFATLKRMNGKSARAYIYLGDGGGSRLMITVNEGKIFLGVSSVSTDEVKEKWAKLQ